MQLKLNFQKREIGKLNKSVISVLGRRFQKYESDIIVENLLHFELKLLILNSSYVIKVRFFNVELEKRNKMVISDFCVYFLDWLLNCTPKVED